MLLSKPKGDQAALRGGPARVESTDDDQAAPTGSLDTHNATPACRSVPSHNNYVLSKLQGDRAALWGGPARVESTDDDQAAPSGSLDTHNATPACRSVPFCKHHVLSRIKGDRAALRGGPARVESTDTKTKFHYHCPMKCYMYILLCENGHYYTGSTKNLEQRLEQHWNGEGANFTRKYPPVSLVYTEEFDRIDHAFQREKQVQRWSHAKKEALIKGDFNQLRWLSLIIKFEKYTKKKLR